MPNEAGEQSQGKSPETAGGDLRGDALATRRPYVTPKLTRLGAVRDLTFGFTGSQTESQTGKMGKAPPRH